MRNTRTKLTLLLGLLAGLLVGAPASAQTSLGDVARGNSFGKAFDTGLRKATVVEVPLVAMKDSQVVMANYKEMNRLGIKTPKYGARSGQFDAEIKNAFAFRPATPEEIAAKKFTHVGLATKYADKYGAEGVKGDGRAALTGEVIVKNRKGAITGVFDIQVKGIGTGLHPNWKGFGHRHGKESLRQAVEDALFSDFLTRNGIRTNKWLAVIGTKEDIVHPDGGRERAGLLVRGGNFLRMAHFNLVRKDPKQLRQLVDFANKQISLEMGRNRPLSITGLYKQLTKLKAKEMTDMYFLRTVHGSTTYDNIGLMENMDHGTGSTVDRTHNKYSFFSKWVGYGGEPKFVMKNYYQTELYNLLMESATPQEKAQLKKLKPERIANGMLEHEMTYKALLHAGFSDGDAKKIMSKNRAAAKKFAKAVIKLSEVQEVGATHKMGKSTQVKDPARYYVFGAMNKLAEVQVTRKNTDARAKAVLKILRAGKQGSQDMAAAKELVQAFEKVSQPILGKASKFERVGKVRLMRERATTRNRHAVDMVRQDLRDHAVKTVDRIKKGENMDAIRADLHAYRRRQVVLGEGSSVYAASKIMSGKVARTKGGLMVVNQHRENGVAIKEVSNGAKDMIQISVAGNPLGLGNAGQYRMHFSVGGDWKDLPPTKVENGKAIFEIPVEPGKKAPKTIQAAFFDGNNRNGKWLNNSGRNYGTNVNLVLGSDTVQTALSVAARRAGVQRNVRMRSSLRAVASGLHKREQHRVASRGKKKTTTPKRPARHTQSQRALSRMLKGTHSAEKFHTFKMKPRKAPKVRAKNTVRGKVRTFVRAKTNGHPRPTNNRRR